MVFGGSAKDHNKMIFKFRLYDPMVIICKIIYIQNSIKGGRE